MRKEIVGQKTAAAEAQAAAEWLDLVSIARVQLTSEDPAFPIENALSTNPALNELGWRAPRNFCCATLPLRRQIVRPCASNGPLAPMVHRRRSKTMRSNWNL